MFRHSLYNLLIVSVAFPSKKKKCSVTYQGCSRLGELSAQTPIRIDTQWLIMADRTLHSTLLQALVKVRPGGLEQTERTWKRWQPVPTPLTSAENVVRLSCASTNHEQFHSVLQAQPTYNPGPMTKPTRPGYMTHVVTEGHHCQLAQLTITQIQFAPNCN